MEDPRGRYRASSALFYADFPVNRRKHLSETTVLAPLDAREADRVRTKLGGDLPVPLFRVEHFFDAEVAPQQWQTLDREGTRRHLHAMSLLAVACVAMPEWHVVVVDERTDVWRRKTYSWDLDPRGIPCPQRSGGDVIDLLKSGALLPDWRKWGGSRWHVDAVGLDRWGVLLRNWSVESASARLTLAADYFYGALVQSFGNVVYAFLSASIALEALLGDNQPTELRFRLSQRGAQLLRNVGDRVAVFKSLRAVYDARSQLVHTGTPPSKELLAWFLMYLRSALPAMAELTARTGGHGHAVAALTDQALQPHPAVEALAAADGWWNVVPLHPVLAGP